jgi:excisionase family DNA binding protein
MCRLTRRKGEIALATAPVVPIDSWAPIPAVIVPRLMRVPDAAKYLAATAWFVETLARDGTIKSFYVGKRRVIDRLELDRYIERRNQEAVEPPASPVKAPARKVTRGIAA